MSEFLLGNSMCKIQKEGGALTKVGIRAPETSRLSSSPPTPYTLPPPHPAGVLFQVQPCICFSKGFSPS